jgi:hypothetical protein
VETALKRVAGALFIISVVTFLSCGVFVSATQITPRLVAPFHTNEMCAVYRLVNDSLQTAAITGDVSRLREVMIAENATERAQLIQKTDATDEIEVDFVDIGHCDSVYYTPNFAEVIVTTRIRRRIVKKQTGEIIVPNPSIPIFSTIARESTDRVSFVRESSTWKWKESNELDWRWIHNE